MASEPEPAPPAGQMLIYQDGGLNVQVRLDGQTVWLTQAAIANLFQTTPQNITLHLRAIYEEGEIAEAATCKDYLQVRQEGGRAVQRSLKHYNLDAILAIGYRVRSARGTAFRQWATEQLKSLLVKGFVLDDERIKAGRTLGEEYFEELLERIRDIRASERLFYQKITDIYATSIDYDSHAAMTHEFFAIVQNKLHWATHGQTAAEVVHRRADAAQPHMGLTTWKNGPQGPVRKADVTVAKNYLSAAEVEELNRIVTMYLDFAEDQARRKKPMHMADWVARLDAFLQFNERNILKHAGKVTQSLARGHAHAEFAKFDEQRRLEASHTPSDFDAAVAEVKRLQESPDTKPAPRRRARKREDA